MFFFSLQFATEHGMKFMEVSAKENINIDEVRLDVQPHLGLLYSKFIPSFFFFFFLLVVLTASNSLLKIF